jgi:hypothetical protein
MYLEVLYLELFVCCIPYGSCDWRHAHPTTVGPAHTQQGEHLARQWHDQCLLSAPKCSPYKARLSLPCSPALHDTLQNMFALLAGGSGFPQLGDPVLAVLDLIWTLAL